MCYEVHSVIYSCIKCVLSILYNIATFMQLTIYIARDIFVGKIMLVAIVKFSLPNLQRKITT